MIDKQNNYFLRIIRSALTGESLELPDDFNLKAAADAAKKHRIFGMFYYGAINCGVSAESEEKKAFRLALTAAAARVLTNAFALLGISMPEKM